jgi:hypothetical protein
MHEGLTVGIVVCAEVGENAYFHLGAYDNVGYRTKASYALVLSVIEYFAEAGFRTICIGSSAGAFADGNDGLSAFKRGWSSGTRMSYLCGHVGDAETYRRLAFAGRPANQFYFPSYRSGEFC